MSIDEDYYKPTIARSAFDLSIKKCLNIINPYLFDIINEHKIHNLVRYHSGNKSWLPASGKFS